MNYRLQQFWVLMLLFVSCSLGAQASSIEESDVPLTGEYVEQFAEPQEPEQAPLIGFTVDEKIGKDGFAVTQEQGAEEKAPAAQTPDSEGVVAADQQGEPIEKYSHEVAETPVQEPSMPRDDTAAKAMSKDAQEGQLAVTAEVVDREHTDQIFEDTEKIKITEAAVSGISPTEMTFDIENKRRETTNLVHRAVQELKIKSLDIVCNLFSHTKQFVYGDLYIFLFDMQGTCLAHGEDDQLIWQNLYNLQDWVGTFIVREIIKKAKEGGGWVTYGWRNATKSSYVQLVEKDGISYAIGSGYFSHSKKEAVINIVKGGVATFDRIKKDKHPVAWAFSRMSYPSGQFIAGDLYLYALDFQGTIMAQGDRPGLIGSNAWDYQDENGLYVNREIVKKLQTTTEGVWVEYVSKRALKHAYAQKVKGLDGKQYFIACGYYPEADRSQTIELVRKGYQFMKTHGKTSAVASFSERRGDEFRYGDLALVVYDLKGKVIADGSNVDNIGRRLYNAQDEDGIYYVQSIIKRSTKEGVWVNAKIRGAFQATYAQRIDLGIAHYVIACSYYPVSKPEMMTLLVQSGASYLKTNPREKAFAEFVKGEKGKFQRGDLKLIVVDTMGLCYVYGDDPDLIWRNIFKAKDDDGRPFIKMFINEAQRGPSVVKTKLNGDGKLNYVVAVEKEGKTYIVASGYYQ